METKLKEMRLPWQLIFIKVEISEYISNFYPFWEYIPRQQNWLARRWANVGTTVLALGVCAGLSKWLCNQFGQSLQKYFLRRKNIFLAEKNISCGKKIFLAEKYFLYHVTNKLPYYVDVPCIQRYWLSGDSSVHCIAAAQIQASIPGCWRNVS